jgi:hypothetical protein
MVTRKQRECPHPGTKIRKTRTDKNTVLHETVCKRCKLIMGPSKIVKKRRFRKG